MDWKPVVGYDGLYEVSNTGLIKSLNYKKTGSERLLKPAIDSKGYYRTALMKNGVLKTVKIHREVAKAFIANTGGKPQVNHINGEKKDNRVENLEWVTNRENIIHAYENSLIKIISGDMHKRVKITDSVLAEMRHKLSNGGAKRAIAREYGCNKSIFRRVELP